MTKGQTKGRLIVREVKTKSDREQFLGLPGRLYRADETMQDIAAERRILDGKHVLSQEAQTSAWLVIRDRDEEANKKEDGNEADVLARCMLITYADDAAAYIGFFECVEDEPACRLLLERMTEESKKRQKEFLRGPLNLSFWIGYRFKIDRFDGPFTSEPYNRPYYAPFWQNCGFAVADRYLSNEYGQIPPDYYQTKHKKRLEWIVSRGYRISHPRPWNFGRYLRLIHRAISELYQDFPGFRPISWPAFRRLFGGLRFVLDPDMVWIASRGGETAGFTIALPDYGNVLQKPFGLTFIKEVLARKRRPKRYIVLYMGVYPQHVGLGSAMAELIKEALYQKGAESVGALIHEGKVTGQYFRALQKGSRQYVWLEKRLIEGSSHQEQNGRKL